MKEYCYIDDALKKTFNPKEYKSGLSKTEEKKIYIDADSYSKRLYEDLKKVYSNIGVTKLGRCFYKLKYKDIPISSDYIGPSRYWASKYLTDIEIGEYLKKTRILGGHMMWPVFENNVNCSRGGSKGYYDRIDCTLYELKLWYENKDKDYKLKNAFDLSKGWLKTEKIKEFKDFIEVFDFKEYVDEKYNVYDLTTYNNSKMKLLKEDTLKNSYINTRERYINYVNASIKLIENRTDSMLKKIKG